MHSREEQISLGAAMIAIALVAVVFAIIVALREEPLVPDPPYVPRTVPPGKLQKHTHPPILIALSGIAERPESARTRSQTLEGWNYRERFYNVVGKRRGWNGLKARDDVIASSL
jgi:hypothetical protein